MTLFIIVFFSWFSNCPVKANTDATIIDGIRIWLGVVVRDTEGHIDQYIIVAAEPPSEGVERVEHGCDGGYGSKVWIGYS